MVTNGSLEACAMLFQHLVGAGERVIVEQPSYDRTLLLLERLGAERVGVALESDGVDTDELERAIREAPVELVHVIPNFHNPAGCTLSAAETRASGRARRRARLLDLRGRPLPGAPLRGRASPDDAVAGHLGSGGPLLVVLQDREPGVRVGIWPAPRT